MLRHLFKKNIQLLHCCKRFLFQFPGPKSLDQIVKMRYLEKEFPEQVKHIWNSHHYFKPDLLSDAIRVNTYETLLPRMRKCPLFIIPIQKKLGYVNYMVQCQEQYILITSLLEFKKRGEYANPYLCVSHFTELAKSKQLVLMRGEINMQLITKPEAIELIRLTYIFYLSDRLYLNFVEPFNKTPHLFDYEKFLQTVKKLKLIGIKRGGY